METMLNSESNAQLLPSASHDHNTMLAEVVFGDFEDFSSLQLFEKYVRSMIPDYKRDEYFSTFGWGALFGGQQTSILKNVTMSKSSRYTFSVFSGHDTYLQIHFSEYGFEVYLDNVFEIFFPQFKKKIGFKEFSEFQDLIETIMPIVSHVYLARMVKDGYAVNGVIQ